MSKIDIPKDLEQRVKEVEKKAEKLLPGDYTVEVNLFTDDTGKDAHIVAVHNFSEDHSLRLHEGNEELVRCGNIHFGGIKIPARMGGAFYE